MHKYLVSGNEQLTPTTLLLTLKKDPAELPLSFQPGQYAAISFKRHGRPTPARCFSIVSSPTDQGHIQFSTRTKGRFTKALKEVKIGDEVLVRGSFGGFVFDAERDQEAILIAGGIGVTPFISMVRYATDVQLSNKITLLLSSQNQDDVPFANELKKLQKRNPNLKIIFVIDKGDTDKFESNSVKTGRISPEILDQVTNKKYTNKTFFVCGPPPFMKAMTKLVQDKGVNKSSIITEAFSQGPNRQTGKILGWPYNVYALGAVGVLLISSTVMIADLLKTLPPSSSIESNTSGPSLLTSNKTFDLNKLVNNLPSKVNPAPSTHAVKVALNAAKKKPATTPETSSGLTQTTPQTANPPSAAPTVTPTPKCTTTQSGVSVCN